MSIIPPSVFFLYNRWRRILLRQRLLVYLIRWSTDVSVTKLLLSNKFVDNKSFEGGFVGYLPYAPYCRWCETTLIAVYRWLWWSRFADPTPLALRSQCYLWADSDEVILAIKLTGTAILWSNRESYFEFATISIYICSPQAPCLILLPVFLRSITKQLLLTPNSTHPVSYCLYDTIQWYQSNLYGRRSSPWVKTPSR